MSEQIHSQTVSFSLHCWVWFARILLQFTLIKKMILPVLAIQKQVCRYGAKK